jgi:hypothetical protein
MNSQYCSMEEAFTGSVVVPGQSKKKHRRREEGDKESVPPQLSGSHAPLTGSPDLDRQVSRLPNPEVLRGPSAEEQRNPAKLESTGMTDFFPLPGSSADSEEWAKAFTLAPSSGPGVPAPRFDGSFPVDGRSTLWRSASPSPAPMPAMVPSTIPVAPVSSDVSHRLDQLTRQLESLTTPTPLQSTAELFLFVAIGLLFLLAIDTLLRFVSGMMNRSQSGGGYRGGFRLGRSVRGYKFH